MSSSRRNATNAIWNEPTIFGSPDPPKPKYKDAAVNISLLDVANNGKDRSKMTTRIDETTTTDLEKAFDAIEPHSMHISRGCDDDDDRKLQNLLLALNINIAKPPQ